MSKQSPLIASAMVATAIAAAYRIHLQPWMYRWGACDSEVLGAMPGDNLVADSTKRTTRAITIDAGVHDVWPWLAQIGEHRGGFYSYSLLERAVGADIHNAATIHPEWQQLEVGDTIWLASRYGPAARQIVAELEPERSLVLMSPRDFDRLQNGDKATGCWSFALRPENGGLTRLVVRGSGDPVGHFWFDIPHFVMEQKMMRGIRARAERDRREGILLRLDQLAYGHMWPSTKQRAAGDVPTSSTR